MLNWITYIFDPRTLDWINILHLSIHIFRNHLEKNISFCASLKTEQLKPTQDGQTDVIDNITAMRRNTEEALQKSYTASIRNSALKTALDNFFNKHFPSIQASTYYQRTVERRSQRSVRRFLRSNENFNSI